MLCGIVVNDEMGRGMACFLRGSMIEVRKWDLIEGLGSDVRSIEARVVILHSQVGDCLNLPLNASDVMSGTCTARCQQPRRSSDYPLPARQDSADRTRSHSPSLYCQLLTGIFAALGFHPFHFLYVQIYSFFLYLSIALRIMNPCRLISSLRSPHTSPLTPR